MQAPMYTLRVATKMTIEALVKDSNSLHETACPGRMRSLEAYILSACSPEVSILLWHLLWAHDRNEASQRLREDHL